MTVWMYYHTDGDSGYYAIKLFATKAKAETWSKAHPDAYAGIREMRVD